MKSTNEGKTMRNYTKMSFKQSLQVADYIKANHSGFNGKNQELILSEAVAALGFDMPLSGFVRIAKEIGFPLKRRKSGRPATKPTKGDEWTADEGRIIYRRIRTLARIQRKIVDELGMKLKPIQDGILTQLCQYDVTAPDDEQ
jgi:hypothetical protein